MPRTALTRIDLVGLCFALGCTAARESATATATPTPTATATATATPIVPVDAGPPRAATVGDDGATTPRRRYPTAVVLFGTRDIVKPGSMRFQPILCAIDGVLAGGLACSQAMPATATARLTHVTAATPRTVTLTRAQRGYKDDNGGRTYRAPLEPSCCMYNTCVGETHAFLASPAVPLASAGLAVWPADAEIDLVPRDGAIDEASAVRALALPKTAPKTLVTQAFRAGGRTIVAGTARYGAAIAIEDAGGFAWLSDTLTQARSLDVLATTDLDHDGNVELLVYEAWANDFGLSVFGNRGSTPLHRFNCGNI